MNKQIMGIIFFSFVLIFSCSDEAGSNDSDGYATVKYFSLGGTSIVSQTVQEGSLIVKPEDPERTDYTFKGWFKEAACLNAWNFLSDKVLTDLSLYAGWVYSNTETFEETDRPNLELVTDLVYGDYYLCKPWNYNKTYNIGRKYPLVIYLHGRDQAGMLGNLYYIGYDNPSGYKKAVSTSFKTSYPSFVYVPQETGTSWNTSNLIAQIEQIKTANPQIDTNRIYLHGFSMGGSGVYSLAKAYKNTQLFAGIIRLSGYGDLAAADNSIVQKTAIWLVVGLNTTSGSPESSGTISNTRTAYSYLKNHSYNTGYAETDSGNYTVVSGSTSHAARTLTCTKSGWEFAKKTEFANDGHYTTEFPFADPSVLAWLFSQSLEFR